MLLNVDKQIPYHFHLTKGTKKGCSSAVRRYEYIAAKGAWSSKNDVIEYGSRNLPSWSFNNASVFWSASDTHERANGVTSREIELMLPRVLTRDQHLVLIQKILDSLLPQNVCTWAYHQPPASDRLPQPHVHILFSTRLTDDIVRGNVQFFKRYLASNPENGGARKDTQWGGSKYEPSKHLLYARALTAKLINDALRAAERDEWVTHLEHTKTRDICEDTWRPIPIPQPKLGKTTLICDLKGIETARRKRFTMWETHIPFLAQLEMIQPLIELEMQRELELSTNQVFPKPEFSSPMNREKLTKLKRQFSNQLQFDPINMSIFLNYVKDGVKLRIRLYDNIVIYAFNEKILTNSVDEIAINAISTLTALLNWKEVVIQGTNDFVYEATLKLQEMGMHVESDSQDDTYRPRF